MDNDAFEDDIIGYGSYNIMQFLQQRMNTTSKEFFYSVMVDLMYKRGHAGRVTLGIEFGPGAMGVGMMGVGMNMGMGPGPMGPMGGMGMGGPMGGYGGGMGPMGGMGGMGYGNGW